jgi:hypothetical protein
MSARYKRRHPCEKAPWWLRQLAEDIKYWMTKSSRLRHSEPFNKRKPGKERRAIRQFKLDQRNKEFVHDPYHC